MNLILCISCDCLSGIGSCVTAAVTAVGVLIAMIEYYAHKKREKTATLAKYNERYSTDPNIQKVVNYLLWKIDSKEEGRGQNMLLYGGSNEDDIKPTINQVEMFMRFFEELQISIDDKLLKSEVVKNLFTYYAEELNKYYDEDGKTEEDWLPNDYHKDAWKNFHKFVGRKVKNS